MWTARNRVSSCLDSTIPTWQGMQQRPARAQSLASSAMLPLANHTRMLSKTRVPSFPLPVQSSLTRYGCLAPLPVAKWPRTSPKNHQVFWYKIERTILLHVPQQEKLSQVEIHKSEPSVLTSISTGSQARDTTWPLLIYFCILTCLYRARISFIAFSVARRLHD